MTGYMAYNKEYGYDFESFHKRKKDCIKWFELYRDKETSVEYHKVTVKRAD